MTHANCGCCCDNAYPLLNPTGATGAFFQYLNGTGTIDYGPLAPQEYRGQGFALRLIANPTGTGAVAENIARAGQIEFPGFQGDIVYAGTAVRYLSSWFPSSITNAPASGATISVELGQHVASNGGALATGPTFLVSKTLTLDGTQVPLDGLGMPTGTTEAPSLVLHRCRLADDLDLMTATDGPIGPRSFADPSNTFRYYRTPTGLIREQKSIKPTLEGRVVVERDGVVVADLLRPTGPVYDAAIAADGSYVVSKYFGREHDDPNKLHLWPPRPERLVSSFAKDTTPPKYGFWTPNDHYSDESFASVGVGGLTQKQMHAYATKPYPVTPLSIGGTIVRVLSEDESFPGAAVRPNAMAAGAFTRFLYALSGSGLQRSIGFQGTASSTEYRDVFGQLPTSLPVVPWRVFSVPAGGKGPRPVLEHPAELVREPYRCLTQSEQVRSVALTFSEDILPAGVTADQVQLTADGVAVAGCTITPVRDGRRQYTIGVPTGPQTEGTFLVLTYDPAGQVVSAATGARPAELAARTSWMMQKPYKQDRLVAVGERMHDIGRLATLSATGPIGPTGMPLKILLTTAAHISKSDFGTVAHRPTQDLFAPQMPFDATGPLTSGPHDCSYYGMTTTIWPCSPTGLACPMPRLPQPHTSAFRHGRAANGITVTLTGGRHDYYGPLAFVPTRNGQPMPQGTWATTTTLSQRQLIYEAQGGANDGAPNDYYIYREYAESGVAEGTLTAVRMVTEYPALGQAFAWNLELRLTLRIVETYSWEVETVGTPTFPPNPAPPSPRTYQYSEFYAAVTAAEELAGSLVRQPGEYGFESTFVAYLGTFRSAVTTSTFSWPAPGTPSSGWPLGTVQVDF